jgi:Fe-S-cluster-containing hydrogenase component 2/CRP-like cAMP-binding protein
MTVVNIPIDIREVADEPLECDELLGVYELQEFRNVPPFSGMKPGPENFPGAMILRRCARGRVLCYQGAAGRTAFQILSPVDALNVLRALRRALDKETAAISEALAAGPGGEWSVEFLEELRERELTQGEIRRQKGLALDEEIVRLSQRLARTGVVASPVREVAQARILTAPTPFSRGTVWKRLLGFMNRSAAVQRSGSGAPAFIPNDGPQDLSAGTLSAPMYEGDLFGEMSCLNLAPRSATVIATEGTESEPVYMIEMVRNALDALRSNADYRRRMDEIYRTRVMENQVRSLSLFRILSDEDYAWLAPRLELVEFRAGDIIFDEHDHNAESCYVIRNGVVKVSRGLGCLLRESDILNTKQLATELSALAGRTGIARSVGQELEPALTRTGILQSAADSAAFQRVLNSWIQTSRLHQTLGSTIEQVLDGAGLSDHAALFADFQEKPADWWQLEVRIFNRMMLERLCPGGLRSRAVSVADRRTLSYAGRGEIIGEIAVLCREPRTATCLSFTHPSSGQKLATQANLIPQHVEAVKISGSVLQELIERSPAFRRQVEGVISQRRIHDAAMSSSNTAELRPGQTAEFEALGLAWGQSLMLIDLDRCTRCQECVKACVAAHDDGRTRLYLDGPRFEGRYLVPVTCRQCFDPVCMIGCPVGAINRGSGGEIRISDHCIGCSKCADQCPYGSIQMDLLDRALDPDPELLNLLGPGYVLRSVQERAVVCDQCQSTPSGKPNCVYACPHEAAIRVEGQKFFDS